jgi:quercetin dioxygenase-like cupin family protein
VRAGESIGEHAAPGPVIIMPLFGTAIFSDGNGQRDLRQVSFGHILFIVKGQKHQVAAKDDCAFLIFMGLQS